MTTINVKQRDTAQSVSKAVKGIVILVLAIILVVILFNLFTFTVGESEQAVVFRFGKIDRVILDRSITFTEENPDLMETASEENIRVGYGKGLQFKLPFIDRVTKYESWLQTYISQQETVNTADKKQYMITMYAQWRVANPALFFLRMQTKERASQYFDSSIYPILVQRVNGLQADDFLSNKDQLNKSLGEALLAMNAAVRDSGIEVADVQVYRTLLPNANLQSTYERMVANRQKVAQQLRSEGDEEYQKSVAEADLEASKLIADATKQSKEIKGKADAEALEIYANSYSTDPEFYGYWRTLQMMKDTLSGTTIVLNEGMPIWTDLLKLIGQGNVELK